MNNHITSDEVASQLAKSVMLLLEWIRQEFHEGIPQPSSPIVSQANLETDRLLKVNEVAKILQVSRSMIYQMILRNEIPSVRFGKSVRVRQIDLDKIIHHNE